MDKLILGLGHGINFIINSVKFLINLIKFLWVAYTKGLCIVIFVGLFFNLLLFVKTLIFSPEKFSLTYCGILSLIIIASVTIFYFKFMLKRYNFLQVILITIGWIGALLYICATGDFKAVAMFLMFIVVMKFWENVKKILLEIDDQHNNKISE